MLIHHYEIISPLDLAAVRETLRKNSIQRNWFWFGAPKTKAIFSGHVGDRSFRLMYIFRGRDSFNPVMYGKLLSADTGTRIRILMTLHPYTWTCLAGLTMYLVYCGIHEGISGSITFRGMLGGSVFFLFGWGTAVYFFNLNVLRNSKELDECLSGRAARDGA